MYRVSLTVYLSARVTREHRENLVKLAKQFSNKAKDSLRRVRSNAISQVKKSKEGVSDDTIHLIEKQVIQTRINRKCCLDLSVGVVMKYLESVVE